MRCIYETPEDTSTPYCTIEGKIVKKKGMGDGDLLGFFVKLGWGGMG